MRPESTNPRLRTRLLYKHSGSLNACALSPDASLAVLGGDQPPDFPFGGGRPVHVLTQRTSSVIESMFISDAAGGARDASAAAPSKDAAPAEGAARPAGFRSRAAAPAPAPAPDARAKRGRVERGVGYDPHSADVWGASVSGDARTAATCDLGGIVHVWETQTAKQRNTFSLETRGADPVSVTLSEDAKALLATDGSALSLWDVQRGVSVALARTPEPRIKKRLVACALVGRCAAGAGEDGRVFLWDTREAKVKTVLEYHNGCVNGVAMAARNERCLVSAGSDRLVCVWDTRKPARPVARLRGHLAAVSACAVDAGGSRLVSAACDRTVRVWRGAECEAELTGHRGAVECCAISADGNTILSVGKDGKAQLHAFERTRVKAESEEEREVLPGAEGALPKATDESAPMEGCTVPPEGSKKQSKIVLRSVPEAPKAPPPPPVAPHASAAVGNTTSIRNNGSGGVAGSASESAVRSVDAMDPPSVAVAPAASVPYTNGRATQKKSFTPPSKKAAAAAMAGYAPPSDVPDPTFAPLPPPVAPPMAPPTAITSVKGASTTTTIGSSEPPSRDPAVISLAPAVFHTALVSRGLGRGDGLVHSDAVEEIGSLFENDVGILNALGEYAIAEKLVLLDQSSDYRIREPEFVECVRAVRRGLDDFQLRIWRDAFCRRAGGDEGLITLPQARQMVLASVSLVGTSVTLDTVKAALDEVALPTRRLGLNEWLMAMQRLMLSPS